MAPRRYPKSHLSQPSHQTPAPPPPPPVLSPFSPQPRLQQRTISPEEAEEHLKTQREQEERIEEAASLGRLLFDTFESVGSKYGNRGLASSRWADANWNPSPASHRKPDNLLVGSPEEPKDEIEQDISTNLAKFQKAVEKKDIERKHLERKPVERRPVEKRIMEKKTIERIPVETMDHSRRTPSAPFDVVDDPDAFMSALDKMPPIGGIKRIPSNAPVQPEPVAASIKQVAIETPISVGDGAEVIETSIKVIEEVKSSVPIEPPTPTEEAKVYEIPIHLKVTEDNKSSIAIKQPESDASGESANPPVIVHKKEKAEDREHLSTFENWGPQTERIPTINAVRRIILTDLPAYFCTPSRVLSLIHGGLVENLTLITSKQTAEVLFCDAAACKEFYDKYPNGIEVSDAGRRGVIFVDKGKEVDIVSSRIRESLNYGATRVLRASGAPLSASMADLARMVEDKNFRVEKIIDTFEPMTALRTVVFRFCSIDHAVRFRAGLVRLDRWEEANVQYGTDPCATATKPHWE